MRHVGRQFQQSTADDAGDADGAADNARDSDDCMIAGAKAAMRRTVLDDVNNGANVVLRAVCSYWFMITRSEVSCEGFL